MSTNVLPFTEAEANIRDHRHGHVDGANHKHGLIPLARDRKALCRGPFGDHRRSW